MQQSPRHPKAPSDLSDQLPNLEQQHRSMEQEDGEDRAPPTEVFASHPALGHRVGDPTPLDHHSI
ncbi:hypothetical protein RF647_05665 [Kocuria sp. CPCC 205263]